MSYNNNYGGQGYGQYDPYNSRQDNRYDQDVEARAGYEMTPLQSDVQAYGQTDRHAILNQCRDVDKSIDTVDGYIDQMNGLYRRLLSDADPARENALRAEADELARETKLLYTNLIQRMKSIKQSPNSGEQHNSAQIGKVERRLKATITNYTRVQSEFRKGSEAQMARQYRIVRPDATDAEVQEAVQDPSNQQVFSQALIQSDRRGDAQKVSQMVRARHDEIQKIQRDLVELAQMFQELDAIVIQQGEAVDRIDQQAEIVHEDVVKANEHISGAIDKARARNKKKWICLGIVALIILIVVLVCALYFTVGPGGNKGGK